MYRVKWNVSIPWSPQQPLPDISDTVHAAGLRDWLQSATGNASKSRHQSYYTREMSHIKTMLKIGAELCHFLGRHGVILVWQSLPWHKEATLVTQEIDWELRG